MGIGSLLGAGANMMGLGTALGIGGSLFTARENRKQQERNADLQREFAQHGIRWRAEDARAAGLHPLYALGASTPSFSPTVTTDPIGPALQQMGQSVANAVTRQETSQQRYLGYLATLQAEANLKLTHAEIANKLSERALKTQAAAAAAPFPPSIQHDPVLGSFEVKPPQITGRNEADPSLTAGPGQPGWELRETAPGSFLTVFPQESVSEMFENPVTGLWALNETLARDPEFFKKNRFPFGRWFYDSSEALWNFLNRNYVGTETRKRAEDRAEHERELYLMEQRGRSRRPQFRPYWPQGR